MTEDEWLTSADPKRMLKFLRLKRQPTERKLRLLAAACCRRMWHELSDWNRACVEESERFADGLSSPVKLRAARLLKNKGPGGGVMGWLASKPKAAEGADQAIHFGTTLSSSQDTERTAQSSLFRDIFPNPFQPVAFDPAWFTSTVVAIAHGTYDSRDFSPMPILADALQDAGCDNADILTHCRGDGPHVRGCWVIDAILGKA